MLVIAHRGDQEKALENTLEAFESALKLGAPMIELDVQQSKDGELFVHHDSSLYRLSGKDLFLKDLSASEIERLELKDGYKIPKLKDVLNLLHAKVKLNIEIKDMGATDTLLKLLEDEIKSSDWTAGDFIISSFFHDEIKKMHKSAPNFKYAIIAEAYLSDFEGYILENNLQFLDAVHLNFEFTDEALVSALYNLGFKVNVFTVNTKREFEYVKNCGVDGIFTNNPSHFL